MSDHFRRGGEPILCVGSALWDVIARAATPLRTGHDAPGRVERRPGGVALNVALALAGLGRRPVLLSAVGRDADGEGLLAEATARGVDCVHALRHDGPTDRYVAVEDASGEVFVAVADCAGLEAAGAAVLLPATQGPLAKAARPWTGAVVCDGNLGEAALRALVEAPSLARARLTLAAASPGKAARLAASPGRDRFAIHLNRGEAEAACGAAFADAAAAACALREIGFAEAVVTDGADAAAHAGPHGVVARTPARVAPRSLTGAGDVFLAAHLAAREDGFEPTAALEVALAAAGRHITREAP